MADPYIQEAKKYTEPYIDRVAMVTKTHLDKLQERKCQCSSPCCKPEMEDIFLMIIFINSFMEQQRFDEVQGLLGKMNLSKNVCFQKRLQILRKERAQLTRPRDSTLQEAHIWRSEVAKASECVVILESAVVRPEDKVRVAEADAQARIKEARN
ncbi:hypothetical protein ACFX2A_009214 [Malus domestica]